MATKRLEVKKDDAEKILDALRDLMGKQVLVGIPESTASREDEPINNAQLAYIHEFGSPSANIPARPFLIPGVEKVREQTTAKMRAALVAAMDGDGSKSDAALNAAGVIAMNSARNEISTGSFVPLKPETIARRHVGRGTKSRRDSETKYLELVAGGMSPADAQSAAGIRPLIDTGSLRNSLTYVLRKKK